MEYSMDMMKDGIEEGEEESPSANYLRWPLLSYGSDSHFHTHHPSNAG